MGSVQEQQQQETKVILFYKYARIPDVTLEAEQHECLCEKLELSGRVLLSADEGCNGTLAGSIENIDAYCSYMINHDVFRMTQTDFKISYSADPKPFPDMVIKVVNEIINTGGKFSTVPIEQTGKGYLSPEQWHDEMLKFQNDETAKENTVLIDVRNHKECQIGTFDGAIDPQTRTFCEMPNWIEKNSKELEGKKVLMYCTGGIRCEKVSAYVRDKIPGADAYHLKGGIHKYLDQFGSDGLFKGKNYIFDKRGADDRGTNDIVGKCVYCSTPFDTFKADVVCAVCREPVLSCDECCNKKQDMNVYCTKKQEHHCEQHLNLADCYFVNLSNFSNDELKVQQAQLQEIVDKIANGKEHKNKRRTLHLQMRRIQAVLDGSVAAGGACRSCLKPECDGNCWGFHGNTRQNGDGNLRQQQFSLPTNVAVVGRATKKKDRKTSGQRASNLAATARAAEEQKRIGRPPSVYRHPSAPVRVPPPHFRTLTTQVKGRWAGRYLLDVFAEEFVHYSSRADYERKIACGELCVEGKEGQNVKLCNGDVVVHKIHWHEPPIIVPESIEAIGHDVTHMLGDGEQETQQVYAVNKPSTVPVHPCGPYVINSLTVMLESQEAALEHGSLIPCHRIDKETSGLVLLSKDKKVVKYFTQALQENKCKKLYLVRVCGRFDPDKHFSPGSGVTAQDNILQVDAPIDTIDVANGIRRVGPKGKPSISKFALLHYHQATETSLLLASPITGRTHQLRVHLQYLGYPVANDYKYGGDLAVVGKTWPIDDGNKISAAARDLLENKFDEEDRRAIDNCSVCRDPWSAFSEAQREPHGIWLHSWKFFCGQKWFEVATPDWCDELWQPNADADHLTESMVGM